MLRALLLYLAARRRLGEAMERLPVARRIVRRFVPGTTVEAALDAAGHLNARGLAAAITYLGENVVTPDDARRAADAYVGVLDAVARRALDATPSLKLTHLGLDLSRDLCLANLRRVLARGQATGTVVWMDMESSAYTDRTLDIYADVRREYSRAACVVQAYLRRSAADVGRLVDLGATVRLCKGAYREPASIAFTSRRDVAQSYARLMDRLLAPDAIARGVYPGFATHDERLIQRVRDVARDRAIGPERFEIQMLYGIRHDLHETIRRWGLRLRVLVPFGEAWYGYFVRRLAERPSNLLFLLRQGGGP
jgi:proline dehydrogenase